jgi:hypothetical protein
MKASSRDSFWDRYCGDVLAIYPRLSMQRPILLLAAAFVVVSSPLTEKHWIHIYLYCSLRDFEASFRHKRTSDYFELLLTEPVIEAIAGGVKSTEGGFHPPLCILY